MMPVMPILNIRHLTTYHYSQPVAFGAHRMMLLPRDDSDQRVLRSEIVITPTPAQLTWSRDAFGNHVATAAFAKRASELRFVSDIHLEHAAMDFAADGIEAAARMFPFAYAPEQRAAIERFTRLPSGRTGLDLWSARFLRSDGSADTCALLADMTQAIAETIRHVPRHREGVQTPLATLALGAGTCRDRAVLMIALLRSRGVAARFVSGYLHLAEDEEDEDDLSGGNTHAWVQVFVPGPGWVDVDPSDGSIGNHKLVRVAAVHHPRQAVPLSGTWYGEASEHLAMNVAVKVKAANLDDAPASAHRIAQR
jgi:transglutaminase-like putative cysteine protease